MPPETTAQPNVAKLEPSVSFWVLVVATGSFSGIAGGLLMRLLRLVQHASYAYTSGDFLRGVEQVSGRHRVIVMTIAGVFAGAILYAMERRQGAKNSGLSEAVWTGSGEVPQGRTLLQAVLSIVTVGMGAALGREGALKDTGAVVANRLADWRNVSPDQRRLLVACGAGAGMAAAYNVPLGGAMFAAELLLGSLTLATVVPALTACVAGVACSWLLLPNATAYTTPKFGVSPSLLMWSVLVGPLLGLAAVPYVHSIGWAGKWKPRGFRTALWPLLAFMLVGLASAKFPQLLGNGKNIVQLAIFDQIGLASLLWLVVLRPLATLLCLGSGAPGGLFTPTMTLGALLGCVTGHLWTALAGVSSEPGFALIGASAFLSAATLGPVSSTIFLLELTRGADALMVPLLLATIGATLTARAFGLRSIYSARGD